MAYVDLPSLNLSGEWNVTEPERAIAARLVPLLPEPVADGADVEQRWAVAYRQLGTVIEVIRTSGEELFAGHEGGITSVPGTVTMVDMMFDLVQAISGSEPYRAYLQTGQDRDRAVMENWLTELESELAQFLALLNQAASPQKS
ncbi:MAG: hypothetical protein GEV07_07315 [Streptosporangiales bacterium]|nr:hypothetical protein [Streptosporangiales bacterium]